MEETLNTLSEVNVTEKINFDNLRFGERFSEHMLVMDYADGKWMDYSILPYGKIEVSPSLAALHYGQVVFEGIKAFYTNKGEIVIFRADKHLERLNLSNARLCIPEISMEVFISGLKELIAKDKNWVPNKRGYSLYIRPFVFASDSFLGVRVSETYRFMIITSPVGAYFKEGLDPISLITAQKYTRSVEGGLGATKTPANYAASMKPAFEAKKRGFAQVLWLDGKKKTYIDEVGTMNIFFRIRDRLYTPPLGDTILAGVTRDSVLQLAKSWNLEVHEEKISIEDLVEGIAKGEVQEVFGTGTAAVISAVGKIEHAGKMYTINQNEVGEWSKRFYNEITGIQYGDIDDSFAWTMKVQ